MHFKEIYKLVLAFIVIWSVSCEEETIGDLETGKLEGKVVSKGLNTPIENVKITTNPASTTVFTDVNGDFSIDEISVGEYSVQAEQKEYKTAFEPANILEGNTVSVVIELDSLEADNLLPKRPILLFPEDGALGVERSPAFLWTSAKNDDDEIEYALELRQGEQGATQFFQEIPDTTFTVSALEIGKTYFWQITADDGVNATVLSELSSFTVQGVSDNRYFFVKSTNDNQAVFSGNEPLGPLEEDINQNVVQLTENNKNSFRPKANNTANKIAYIGFDGSESHIFLMDFDGTNKQQLTKSTQIAGFKLDEIEFAWNKQGNKIFYPNFNRLYEISLDGSANRLVYETPSGEFISEVAVNPVSGLLALKTNDVEGYNVRIRIVNPETGVGEQVLIEGVAGAFDGLDFSLDGNRLLYSRDVSGVENEEYRRLDNRIFQYDFLTGESKELDTEKPTGQNDLDPKYAPNDGYVIYVRTSNDDISERIVQRTQIRDDDSVFSEILFTGAFMPYWE